MAERNVIIFHSATAMVSSLLVGLAFESDYAYFGVFVGVAPLMLSLDRLRLRSACAYGAVCGLVTWLLILRWIVLDGQSLIATGIWVTLSIAGCLHWILFAACYCLLRKGFSRLVVLPVLWALLEEARNWIWIGCPWYFVSYPLSSWQAGMQAASVLGASGLSGLVILVNLCVADQIIAANRPGRQRLCGPLIVALSLIGLMHLYGCLAMQRRQPEGEEILAAVMQTNFVSERTAGWDASQMCHEWAELASAATSFHPDIVLAPESCFPNPSAWMDFADSPSESAPDVWQVDTAPSRKTCDTTQECANVLAEIVTLKNQTFLLGSIVCDESNTELKSNSLLLKDSNGTITDAYVKRACLPFYEHCLWGILADDSHSILPARASPSMLRLLKRRNGTSACFAPLICYEDSLPSLYEEYCCQARLLNEPIVFFVGGNEGLCQSSSRAHLQIVQMRAVEFGAPVVRAVNAGQSAYIDEFGRVRMDLGQSSPVTADGGAVDVARVTPCIPHTFYAKHRRSLLFAYVVIVALIPILIVRSKFSLERVPR